MKAVDQAFSVALRPLQLPCCEWQRYMPIINFALQEWQQKEKLPLEKLWKQPESDFNILRENLVDYIEFKSQEPAHSRVTTSRRAQLFAREDEIYTRCQTSIR